LAPNRQASKQGKRQSNLQFAGRGIKGRRCLFRQYAVPAKALRASQAQRERNLVFDAAQFLCRKETLTHATSNKKEPRATNKQQMRRAPWLMAVVERTVLICNRVLNKKSETTKKTKQ
jgi:hypothetical protein